MNYIFPRWVCLFCRRKYADWSWEYINRSQTHECAHWGWGSAQFPEKDYKNGIAVAVWMQDPGADMATDEGWGRAEKVWLLEIVIYSKVRTIQKKHSQRFPYLCGVNISGTKRKFKKGAKSDLLKVGHSFWDKVKIHNGRSGTSWKLVTLSLGHSFCDKVKIQKWDAVGPL